MAEDFAEELIEILRDLTGDDFAFSQVEELLSYTSERNRTRLRFELLRFMEQLFADVDTREKLADAITVVFTTGVLTGRLHKAHGHALNLD